MISPYAFPILKDRPVSKRCQVFQFDLRELVRVHIPTLPDNQREAMIQKIVTDHYNLTGDLYEVTRRREVVLPRQIHFYMCRKFTKLSFQHIARHFDHTSAIHACNVVENLMQTDKDYKYQIKLIENKIKEQI
jgi:chromosomal replication initiation ATPase DnaA